MRLKKTLLLKSLLAATLFILSIMSVYAATELTDQEITNAIDRELMFNSAVSSYLIDVETDEGIVALSGTVNNLRTKERAVQIAGAVKGVRGIVNEIDVEALSRSNITLENEVTDALLEDPATDSYEINVKADQGKVTLTGTVDSWQEKQLSGYVAKGVKGITELENNLIVDYKTDRSDIEIKQDIVQSLKNDVRIDHALIDVNVKDGEVTLSGKVGSVNERTLAVSESWVVGVSSVDSDEVEITEWARAENLRKDKYIPKSDEEIKDAVNDAFLYDPRVYSFNPEVSVFNGTVTLTGTVNNLKAKRAAEHDARNVVGVFNVNNYLKVRPVYVPEDYQLESDVEAAIDNNILFESWDVDVTASAGLVYLNGEVDSYFQKKQAEDIASKTKGVIAVENNLKVNDTNDYYYDNYYGWNSFYAPGYIDVSDDYLTDFEIENRIQNQLWWSPYVNEDEVDVLVAGGTAVLTGTVETQREKLYAEVNALEGGADEVENNLIVSYNPKK
jgi:osmotically-inducible protein OsmY